MENFKKHTVMCKKQEISRLEGSELLSKSFNLHICGMFATDKKSNNY